MSTAPTPSLEGPTVEGLMKLVKDYGSTAKVVGFATSANERQSHVDSARRKADAIEAYAASISRGVTTDEQLRQFSYSSIIAWLEGRACNTDTDPRWVAATELRRYVDGRGVEVPPAIEAECAEPAVVRMLTDEERRQVWEASWKELVLKVGDSFMDGALYAAAIERKLIEVNGLKLEGDA